MILERGECYLDDKDGKPSKEELVKSEDGSVSALIQFRIIDIVSLLSSRSPTGHSCSKNSNLPSHGDILLSWWMRNLHEALKRLSMSGKNKCA